MRKKISQTNKKPFPFSRSLTAFGIFLFILVLVTLLSPGTHLFWIAYVVEFPLGWLGLYVLNGFLIFLSITILLRKKRRFGRLRIFAGALVLMLGVMLLGGFIANKDLSLADGFTPYLENFDEACKELGDGLLSNPTIAGGILGYYGALLLKDSIGAWLVFVLSALLCLLGLLIIFFPFILTFSKAAAVEAKKRRAAKAKEKDRREKEAALAEMAKEKERENTPYIAPEDIDNSFFEKQGEGNWNSPLDRFFFTPASSAPVPSSSAIAESRSANRPSSPSPFSGARENPNPAPISTSGPITPLGLQEAHFDIFDEKKGEEEALLVAESLPETSSSVAPASSPFASPKSEPLSANPYEPSLTKEEPKMDDVLPQNEEKAENGDDFDFDSFAPKLGGHEEAVFPHEEKEPVAPEPVPETEPIPAQPAPAPAPTPVPSPAPIQEAVAPAPSPVTPAPAPVPAPPVEEIKPWVYPDESLLQEYDEEVNMDEVNAICAQRAEAINQKFRDLGVGAHVCSYTCGPSVTRYDIETDPNVSVSSISRYIKDISQAMGGVATRFTEIVPGHTTSALEVVNEKDARRIVPFKEVFKSLPPMGKKSGMVIPFGVDIENNAISGNLASFPHMLVAGTTGSGKSIFIQGILMTLIMRNTPDELRLVLVDPKRVEFSKYRDIPHLLCPIIKEASEAKVALRKMCEEMERRYKIFEECAVSNIAEYNNDYCEITGAEKLAYVVLVVDEYADLVEQEKDVASSVARLSAKARACGIHMLICTQRPDTKVITGTIKNNLSTRVALHLKSIFDSQTILNQPGAEELADHGDMIVDCDKVSRHFLRLQGCLVGNREIMAVTEFCRKQRKVVYHPYFSDFTDPDAKQEAAASTGGSSSGGAPSNVNLREDSFDTVYAYVRDAIMAMDATSISRIQREFRVGYPRASEIFNKLIEDGIVAPKTDAPNSSRPCQVLVHSLEELNGGKPSEPAGPGSLSSSTTSPLGPDDF